MRNCGIPDQINKEIFIAVANSFYFINYDKISMKLILITINLFLGDSTRLYMEFINGNHPVCLCNPMAHHTKVLWVEFVMSSTIKKAVINKYNTINNILIRYSSKVVWNFNACLKLPLTFSIVWPPIPGRTFPIPSVLWNGGHNKY